MIMVICLATTAKNVIRSGTLHLTIASLSDGISSPNYGHKMMAICIAFEPSSMQPCGFIHVSNVAVMADDLGKL